MFNRLVAVAITTATLFGSIATTSTPSFATVYKPICPVYGPCCFDFKHKCGQLWELD